MKKVCIFIEHKNGVPTLDSQKILFMAQTLKRQYGYVITVIVLDKDPEEFLVFLKDIDVDAIFYAKLNVINPCCLKRDEIKKLIHFIKNINPDIIWGCNSISYKTLFPKIAYVLNTGLCAACLDYQYEEVSDRIDMIRMAYSNNVYAQIAVHRSKPLMATIVNDSKAYTISSNPVCAKINDITSDIILPGTRSYELEMAQAVDNICLNTSKIVIGLGNGIHEKTDLALFKELAATLNNAAIGGTRELVNRQIIPQGMQIGTTGIHIHADLYIAFGISGSPQHMQGIEQVKQIIAVNHDPYAAIFQYADYGIIGDLFEVANYMINYLGGKCA